MSHFVALVLVDKNSDNVERDVEDLLAPYSENIEVEGYEEACWCVGRVAKQEAINRVNAEIGTLDDVERPEYEKLEKEKLTELAGGPEKLAEMEKDISNRLDELFSLRSQARKALTQKWRELTAKRQKLTMQYEQEHEQYGKPDPNCSTCEGKGIYMSTYNPDSHWDWWQIGGRWSGALKEGYEPSEDPRNIETCRFCYGEGKREDGETCVQCGGKGKSVKWPTQWANSEGNIVPVEDMPESFIPYAVVTPDGEWHQKGKMGWWGISTEEKEEEEWEKACKDAFEKHKGTHLAVVVDCHI